MSTRISNKPAAKSIESVLSDTAFQQAVVLDSQFEILFDSIIKLVVKVCEVQTAVISFVEDDRILYKSDEGYSNVLDTRKRDLFCGMVAATNKCLEISDISKDKLYQTHKLDLDGYKFKFFAGAPIKLPLGEVIGVLCVLDIQPRHLTEMQRDVLLGLSDVLAKALVSKNFLGRAIN